MRYAGCVESMEQIRNAFMYLVANAESGDAIWKKLGVRLKYYNVSALNSVGR